MDKLKYGWNYLKYNMFRKTTTLLEALETNQDDSLVINIIQRTTDVNIPDYAGITPLHLAVSRSTVSVAHELIKKGADVDAADYSNSTPLHYAVKRGNPEVVCMLLYYGADVSIISKKFKLAFTYALIQTLRLDIAEILVNYYDDRFNGLFKIPEIHDTIANNIKASGDEKCASMCITDYNYIAFEFYLPSYTILRTIVPLVFEYVNDKYHKYWTDIKWLQYIYIILEASIAIDLTIPTEEWTKNVVDLSTESKIFSSLYYCFYNRNIEQSDRLAITYICLSLGIQTQSCDIEFVYQMYGFNEELEALLYGTTYLDEIKSFYPLPYFILALEENCYSKSLIFELFKYQINNNRKSETCNKKLCIINSLSYFSLSFDIKQQLLSLWPWKENGALKEFSEKLDQIPEVPSLVELSRNKSRIFIKQKFNIKKPYHFHDAVKSLGLPTHIDDIIRFKSPIYR